MNIKRKLMLVAALATAWLGAATLPRPAGDLTIKTLQGPQMLSMHRGKVVVLSFIHTNCRTCQEVSRIFNTLYKEFQNRGVIVLEGAFDPDAPLNIEQFIRSNQPSFPVGVIDPEKVIEFTQVTEAMRPTAPLLVFIDRKGQIRAQYFGSDPILSKGDRTRNLRAEIEKYLK